jgi:hypothetical protein
LKVNWTVTRGDIDAGGKNIKTDIKQISMREFVLDLDPFEEWQRPVTWFCLHKVLEYLSSYYYLKNISFK